MSAKLLFWSLCAFLVFGALAFLAVVCVVCQALRRQRAEQKRWAMDPVTKIRHVPLVIERGAVQPWRAQP